MQAVLKSPSTIACRSKGIFQDGHHIWRSSSRINLLPHPITTSRFISNSVKICSNVNIVPGHHTYRNDRKRPLLVLCVSDNSNRSPVICIRNFNTGATLYEKEPLKPSSKIEETVNAMKNKSTDAVPTVKQESKVVKKSIGQRIWHEILHYYHGFRLLFIDINVSRKLLWRILNGKSLSRREHRLLVRTVGDMFRLVPFSVFIIVPFMEFLLPVAIKLFPNMLPSTFQTTTEKDDKMKQSLKVRLEMAKFLQNTLDEMAVQSKDKSSQSTKEFTEFFRKVRSTGGEATTEEIMKFSKLFEDELTLDSLSRQQLTALCRVLDINTVGTTAFLKFQIRMKLRSLAADDKMIYKEGIDSLTVSELQAACQARAMRAYGVSEEKLKSQLSQWLDLSLNEKVPPSLLLLSRALMLPDTIPATDQLKATISALPETVEVQAKAVIDELEGHIDNKTKIELIKQEEARIKAERAEQRAEKQRQKEELVDTAPIITPATDVATKEKIEAVKTPTKAEELSTKDLDILEDALDALGKAKKRLLVEKEELDELKEEMQEYQEDVIELKQVLETVDAEKQIKETKAARNLFRKVNSMISKMDVVLNQLEKKEEVIKSDDQKDEQKKYEELVQIDELMDIIKKIQKVPDDSKLAKISEILGKIDDDRDGAISVDEVLKVIELIGKEHVQLTTKQLDEIIELLEKEEAIELETQIEKALEKQAPVEKIEPLQTKDSKSDLKTETKSKVSVKQQAGAMAVAPSNGNPNTNISEPKDKNNGTSKQL